MSQAMCHLQHDKSLHNMALGTLFKPELLLSYQSALSKPMASDPKLTDFQRMSETFKLDLFNTRLDYTSRTVLFNRNRT